MTIRTILTDLGLDLSRDLFIDGERVMYVRRPGDLEDSGLTWSEVLDALPAELAHPKAPGPISITRDRGMVSIAIPGQAIRTFDHKTLLAGGAIEPLLDLEVA